ncbi:cysteine synthase, partial [Enterococcus faecalis]
MIVQSILVTIGATPLFEFTSEQYPMPEGTKFYAKLEYLNPGG